MSDPTASTASRAVFLSYAHEDAIAARRIAEALREVGVEVWFDQSELRGGDAWDQKIRQQIKECALFIPIVSANTQERGEGYFRLEWKLAVERTHHMAEGIPFLTPVALDHSHEADALVPPEFMRVHWTRLAHSEPTQEFVGQMKRLLDAPRKSTAMRKAESAGSKFVAASAASAAPLPVTPSATAAPAVSVAAPTPAKSRASRWFTLGLVGVAVGAFLWLRRPAAESPQNLRRDAAVTSNPSAAPAANDPKSIAVLPFENRSAEADNNAFFTDGVHDDILTNLAHIRELRVVSRTSVMQYRATKKPIPQIARELGVAYVLEGSVQRSGNSVHVTGQLIRAATDEHVWAESYDRDLTNVFAIQAELAKAIAGELRAALSPQETALIERKRTTNPAADDLYLKARALRRNVWGADTLKSAETMLSRAVDLDPGFAEAWAELADCRAVLLFNDYDHNPDIQAAGRAALDRALQLAPDNPVVIGKAGDYYFHAAHDYVRAGTQYRRLAQMQPNNPLVFHALASIQRHQGQWPEALANARHAVELDPRNGESGNLLFGLLMDARRYGEAEAVTRARVAFEPDDVDSQYHLAWAAYLARGSVAETEAFARLVFPVASQSRALSQRKRLARMRGDFAEAVRLDRLQPVADNDWSPWSQQVSAAVTLAQTGDLAAARARAQAVLPEMVALLPQQPANSWLHAWLSQAYALIGNKDRALFHAAETVRVLPGSRDAVFGIENELVAASTLAWVGEKDRAFTEFTRLLRLPHGGNVAIVRHGLTSLDTMASWQPLLDDPRVQALLADPANDAPLF